MTVPVPGHLLQLLLNRYVLGYLFAVAVVAFATVLGAKCC
jgi:hypothetical protein